MNRPTTPTGRLGSFSHPPTAGRTAPHEAEPDLDTEPMLGSAPRWDGRGPVRHRRGTKPIFLDRSGRRRRIVATAGAAAVVAVVIALVLLVAGLFGASPVPLPGLPDLVGPAPSPGTSGPPSSATEATEPVNQPSATGQP